MTRVRGRTRCQRCPAGHHIQLCPAVAEGGAHGGLTRDSGAVGSFSKVFLVYFPCEEPRWPWHALWLADRLQNELPNWPKAHHCKGSRGGGERSTQGWTEPAQELRALMALCSDPRGGMGCSDPSWVMH